jgi:hypothetical protein
MWQAEQPRHVLKLTIAAIVWSPHSSRCIERRAADQEEQCKHQIDLLACSIVQRRQQLPYRRPDWVLPAA